MENGKCTDGLRRIAIAAAVALMMAFTMACGDDDADCADDEQLTDGECLTICSGDDDCGDDEYCASATPEDVCLPDDDGNGNGDEDCESNDDCEGDEICDDDGQCVDPPSGPECENNDECDGDEICEDGQCVDPPSGPECENNDECDGDDICEEGQCVAPPECQSNEDCESGDQCHEGSCVECVNDGDCPDDWECGDDNTCSDPADMSNEEMCEAFCGTYYGCIDDECDIPDPTFVSGIVDDCLNNMLIEEGDGGCYQQINDPAIADEIETILFSDPNTGEERDELITCADMKPQYCGPFGIGEFCSCTASTTIGDACDSSDECDAGDLPVGECLDFEADLGFDECDPTDPQCEGDEDCWTIDEDTDFHVCAEACESHEDCDEAAGEACFLVEEGSDDAICLPDPDAEPDTEPDIEDGQCIAGPCAMLHSDAELGAGYIEEHGCGPDANCVANPGQQGTVGICQVTCEPGACDGGWVCQTTGPLFDQDTPTQQNPSPPVEVIGASQTCMPACEEDTDCAPDGARCSDGICEFSCDDVAISLMCDMEGGTCESDGDDEYCVL